jgi:hypothetical protein
VAFCVHQFGVFYGISVGCVLPVKLGILQGQRVTAVSAFAILLPPFHGFDLGTSAGLTALIITKFLNHFSAISEEQEWIASR